MTAFNTYLVRRPADYGEKVRALRTRFGLAEDFLATPLGFISGADALATDRHQTFVRELSALYPKASVREFVDHIEYVVKRLGIDPWASVRTLTTVRELTDFKMRATRRMLPANSWV